MGKITAFLLVLNLLLPLFVAVVVLNLPESALQKMPVWLAKPSSTFWHAQRTGASLEVLAQNSDKWLTGFGLGLSGPAAKQEYYDIKKEALFAENEAIAYKWRLVGEDLTIPENWYLQTVFNGGFVYALVYLLLVCLPLLPLFAVFKSVWSGKIRGLNWPELSKFIGVFGFFALLIGNLLLHLWEAQTVAIYWTLTWLIFQDMGKEESRLKEKF